MTVKYVKTDLEKLIGAVKLLRRQGAQVSRFAVTDALRRTATHAERLTQEELTIKKRPLTKRRQIVPPRESGNAFEGSLFYRENAPPIASAFKGFRFVPGNITPGGRSRGGKHGLKLKFRKDEAPQFVNAGWARQGSPGLSRRSDDADIAAAGGLFPTIRGRDSGRATNRVGRMPYFAAYGPSIIGLMESKPGFIEEVQSFMVDKLAEGAQRRYDRFLDQQGV